MFTSLWPIAAALSLLPSDRVPPSALLPADTAVLVTCDDFVGLRAAVDALPVCVALASGDHDELAEVVHEVHAGLVRRALPGIDADALAAAAPSSWFVAFAPDDRGKLELVVGVEWPNAEPEGVLPMPQLADPSQPGLRKRSEGRWSLVTRSHALDGRLSAVKDGKEATLAARPRFATSSGRVGATPTGLRVWIDPDLLSLALFGNMVPFIEGKRPDLARQNELGAFVWNSRVDGAHVVGEMFLGRGASPSVLAVENPQPLENDWLKFVPQDARAFSLQQLAVPTLLQTFVDQLAAAEETREVAGLLGEFVGVFGSRVYVIVPNSAQVTMPVFHAYLELRQSEEAAQALDIVLDALAGAVQGDLVVQRNPRDDGRVVYTIAAPPGLPFPLSVSFTVENQWLVLTTKEAELEALLARVRGEAASDVRSNPRFAELYTRITQGEAPFHGVSFVDPKAAVVEGRPAIAAFATALAGMALGRPVEMVVGDSLLACIDGAPASVSITRHANDGWWILRRGALLGELSMAWTGFGAAATFLPAVVAATVAPILERGRVTKARSDLRAIGQAILFFTQVHGTAPETLVELTLPDPKNFNESYLEPTADLADPWGTRYVYVKHADGTWLLSSLGADQAVGGDGENADLDVRSPP